MARIDFTMKPGDYVYGQDENGKYAYGVVRCGATSDRNPGAQRAAGGAERQPDDHGGHLIAHCLGGRNDETNLDAQNANVNQRGQRHIEQQVSDLANDPNKTVFMSVENYCSNGSERPDATMITVAVYDNTTGQVDVQEYSLQNASYEEQAEWDAIANEYGEVDPRQDDGLTPEQRALANEYAEYEDLDDSLGQGRAFFLDETTAPVLPEQGVANNENGNDPGVTEENDGANLGTETTASLEEDGAGLESGDMEEATVENDGAALGEDAMESGTSLENDGASMEDDGVSMGEDTMDGASLESDDGESVGEGISSDGASMDGGSDGMDGGSDGGMDND